MIIRFLGAARMVTGSCYILEVGATRIMIDCGMFQGPRNIRENNYKPFPFQPWSIDFVLLTHAHIDHSGLIPKLVKNGFKGKILATSATIDLCRVMLPDAGHIQESEVERLNRKNRRAGRPEIQPIYTFEDAQNCLGFFAPVSYGETMQLNSHISVRFLDAGHILGSAIIEVNIQEDMEQTRIVFSGDLGHSNKAYINDPVLLTSADYLLIESTYGDRIHQEKENRLEILHDVLWNTYRKGGNLIIPAFAVERTQDLIYDLNLLVTSGRFPPLKIYIDSPMATSVTEVFRQHKNIFDEQTKNLIAQGRDPLSLPVLEFVRTTEESISLNMIQGGAVIISASGMCDAGRIKHHLKHNLWRPECTVLLVGFQAPGTKGHHLKNGAKTIRIHGEEVSVKAEIKSIEGFSAHADQKALLSWVSSFKKLPRKIFITHGEEDSSNTLAGLLASRLRAAVSVPALGESVQLTSGEVISEEEIWETYKTIENELETLFKAKTAHARYAGIFHQLKNLNEMIESIKQET